MTGVNRAYDLARGLSLRAGLAAVTVAATISSIAAQDAKADHHAAQHRDAAMTPNTNG